MEHQIFEKISKYEGASFFKEIFQGASKAFLDSCSIESVSKDVRFITAEEKADKVWFLLSGEVKVVEEYITGDIYVFKTSRAPEFFGEMEAIPDIPAYRTSLITAADCVFINIPSTIYIQCLKNNPEILFERTKSITKSVFSEIKVNHAFLMLSAMDRIKIYIAQHYQVSNIDRRCILTNTRQQIADETGFSIKTVNRIIKKLSEQRLINISGHKLIISEDQYKFILKDIDEKIN